MPRVSKAQRDKLAEIRSRFKVAVEADRENRREALEDLKFVYEPGEQWPDNVRADRGNRPMYEFNKVRVTVKRIVNDMRSNRPAGKVRGVEEGDKKTAEVIEGLIRNVWNQSDGDTVIDQAAEYQVAGGMGAWRVSVDYARDDVFDQDIFIEPIRNPYNLYCDPACEDFMKRDARYWFYATRIPKSEFEAKYPKAAAVDWDESIEFDDEEEWDDGERVRIVEYWYKEPYQRTLVLLSDGRTVDVEQIEGNPEAFAGLQVVRSRDVMSHRIRMCIASGDAILEEGEWAGSEFPFVIVYGENIIVDGRNRWFGLTRFAKDAQRAYNVSRTLAIETISKAPQSKYWATPTQANGLQGAWAEAHKKNYPAMIYNPDPQAPGPPQEMNTVNIPPSLVNEMQFSSEDIKAVTGIFDASMGARSNETTGVAIRQRQAQGEIVTFNYMDNLGKGIRRTWEILIDLIPKVYDTQRAMRILGTDGAEDYVEINKPDPATGQVMNDVTRGKYDVTVTVGPSFATQRQEAAEIYMGMAQANPGIMQVAGDLIFKAVDLPYAEDIANRMKVLLPPQIQQMEAQGKELPPEAMQAMAQATQAMQLVEQQAMQLQQAQQEMVGEKASIEADKAEIQASLVKLQAEKAVLDAHYREIMAKLDAEQAKAQVQKAGSDGEAEKVTLSAQLTEALAQIQQQAAEFMTQAAAVIADMQARSQPQVIMPQSRGKRFVAERDPAGNLVGGYIEEVA